MSTWTNICEKYYQETISTWTILRQTLPKDIVNLNKRVPNISCNIQSNQEQVYTLLGVNIWGVYNSTGDERQQNQKQQHRKKKNKMTKKKKETVNKKMACLSKLLPTPFSCFSCFSSPSFSSPIHLDTPSTPPRPNAPPPAPPELRKHVGVVYLPNLMLSSKVMSTVTWNLHA